jgi:ACS family hexuronate transporter-like MFS transporter
MPISQAAPASPGPQQVARIIPRPTLILLGAILLGETTINYIDRQVVSVLAPTLRTEFGWSNADYATIINAFLITYAVAYSFAGWVLDKLGIRRGLTLAVTWWSVAGALTSFSRGLISMGAFRSVLAIGEAGAWPAFAKAAATWVPAEARALFIGACNSGSSMGAMIAPPLVAWVAFHWGWRQAFLVTGTFGLIWVIVFQVFMRWHPEFDHTNKPIVPNQPGRQWLELLRYRQTWAVFFCRFLADPVWYFFVFWIPSFLDAERGLNLTGIGLVAWIPFLVADVANFTSGYVTLRLERAGWSVNRTRKSLMVLAAVLSPVGILAVYAHSLFWTLAFISIAIFFWMFWSVTVHTLPGDYFPAAEVGSVYGIAGTGSTVGTAISTWAVGHYLDLTHSYTPVFIAIGLLMPAALVVGLSLMGKVEPVEKA